MCACCTVACKTEATERLYTKWRNADFSELLATIKGSASAEFTDAIFFLYDLAGDGADTLLKNIKEVKRKATADGKGHGFTVLLDNGNMGVTFLAKPEPDGLNDLLLAYCMARKHKARADTWLGFASFIGSSSIVDTAVFAKAPWEPDTDLDALAGKLVKRGKAVNAKGRKSWSK